ncbi:hypothetical protein EVAR_25461_1 [Eumeta japonica]|uniref:Uncharacterized protein n=1 Tax=Eumeta variegata TaxID=151549 RepID=A0A4C1VKK7_EUMVA|nr:hypothetical protein EVAR_25461_1 [Eumeta japonica]
MRFKMKKEGADAAEPVPERARAPAPCAPAPCARVARGSAPRLIGSSSNIFASNTRRKTHTNRGQAGAGNESGLDGELTARPHRSRSGVRSETSNTCRHREMMSHLELNSV